MEHTGRHSDSDEYNSEEEKRNPKRPKQVKRSDKKFLTSYLHEKQFKDWLSLGKDGKSAICTVCNTNLKGGKSELKRHGETKQHIKNFQIKKAPSQAVLTKFVSQTDKVIQLEASMCSFIVEHDLPISFVEPLANFCKSLPEKETINKLQLGKQKATNVLRQGLRPFFNNELREKLSTTPFSVFIDETTDVSTKSQLAVVTTYFDSIEQESKVDVIDIVEMTDATAEGIYNKLNHVLAENNIPLNNWVGFCADTTSVMMGPNHSVSTLIKTNHPQVVIVKCSCHLIHLVASYACKMLPNSLEDLVRTIYNHLKRSPKRTAEFIKFQQFFEPDFSPKKILAPGQTRWLSLQMCVRRILECWESLRQYWTVVVFEDKTHANDHVRNTSLSVFFCPQFTYKNCIGLACIICFLAYLQSF